jgi:hypothetical protein
MMQGGGQMMGSMMSKLRSGPQILDRAVSEISACPYAAFSTSGSAQ